MSRSRKKPYFTDQQAGRKSKSRPSTSVFAKRKANRALRLANKKACEEAAKAECADGKSYRKHSCSWDIRDWSSYAPKNKKAYRK